MLANLNLQLAQSDLSGDSLSLQAFSPNNDAPDVDDFAALLNLRAGAQFQPTELAGQVLPAVGNALPETVPEPDIVITVDDQLGATVAATPVPETDVLVALDPAAVPIGPVDELPPLPAEAPLVEGATLATMPPTVIPGPVTPGPAIDDSATGRTILQQRNAAPETLQALRPDLVQQSPETQAVKSAERSVSLAAPAPMAERLQDHQRRATEVPAGSEDTDYAAPDTKRPVVAAVAAPVVERLADMMRTRVRPTQSVSVTHAHAQPAGFQPLAATASLSDSSFASTLQQQGTDLIRTPVMEPAWGDRIGERVVMLAGQQIKSAEIRLTPAELGPVRVQVNVEEGAANVTFHAQSAVTREALEQALPRLRELLAESGLSLGQADVGDHGVAEGNRDDDSEASTASLAGDDVDASTLDTDATETRAAVKANGLVDTFA